MRNDAKVAIGLAVIVAASALVLLLSALDYANAGNGPDVVHGTPYNDRINSGKGPDIVYGYRGDDRIVTGKGGPGDKAYGGPGNDRLNNFGSGQSPGLLVGGPGFDVCVIDKMDTTRGCEVVLLGRKGA